MNIGDLVILNQDKILNSGKIVCTKGSKFIVNNIRTTQCKCSPGKWVYIWVGQYYDSATDFVCNKCKNVNISDNKVWLPTSYFDKLDPNKEFSTKYSMQDSELLELGTQIMNKLATHEF